MDQKIKYILKQTLTKIANLLSAFLKENKEKVVILWQEYEAADTPQIPTEDDFRAGLKRRATSSPKDDTDGKWLSKLKQSCTAAIPHIVKLSCTTDQTVTVEQAEPSTSLKNAETEAPYLIQAQEPFNKMSPKTARDFLAYAFSGNQECAQELEDMNLDIEEMYNLAAQAPSPTTSAVADSDATCGAVEQ